MQYGMVMPIKLLEIITITTQKRLNTNSLISLPFSPFKDDYQCVMFLIIALIKGGTLVDFF